MYCMICGSDDRAKLRKTKGSQRLCNECNLSTPKKAGPTAFYKAYWGFHWENVRPRIRREFYNDYCVSTRNLSQYIKEQSETV